MDKNEKKLYELMHDQPEGRAEKISECFPPLSDEDKVCSVCGTQMVPIGTEVIRTRCQV